MAGMTVGASRAVKTSYKFGFNVVHLLILYCHDSLFCFLSLIPFNVSNFCNIFKMLMLR